MSDLVGSNERFDFYSEWNASKQSLCLLCGKSNMAAVWENQNRESSQEVVQERNVGTLDCVGGSENGQKVF